MSWHRVTLALMLSSFVAAQQPQLGGPPEAKHGGQVRGRADQRAREMRDQITDGRLQQSHVKVRVRLKNGNRLTGVLRREQVVERVQGGRFVEARANERGAGIRIYYTGGTRSFVFVPITSLRTYEVIERLSPQQLAQLEQQMQKAERRASERAALAAARAARAAEVAAASTAGVEERATAPRPATGGDEPPSVASQQHAWSALLRKFPPDLGWNAAKKDEISRRFVVVGATPSELEREFVEKFADWLQACQHSGIVPSAPAEPKPTTRREARRAERARQRPRRK